MRQAKRSETPPHFWKRALFGKELPGERIKKGNNIKK
jgi:hypothetical protein